MTFRKTSGYEIDIIVTGFPGKAVCHGPLGWSTIVLLRGHGKIALIDVGSFGLRPVLQQGLKARGLTPDDITDVLLTHAHYDHAVNWVMFPDARIVIGSDELDWSLTVPWGETVVPELYMKELGTWPKLHRASESEEILPGITTIVTPGHTPHHLVYMLEGNEHDVMFCGDAAKNRAELMSREADMTMNADDSRTSIEAIYELWARKPGTILVPGHDLPMTLQDGIPTRIGKHEAGVTIWPGDGLEQTTVVDLVVE